MGYTHYWDVSSDTQSDAMEEMTAFVKKAVAEFGIEELGDWRGAEGTEPYIGKDGFSLNGIGDDSHETFRIDFDSGKWDFCKTNNKPYDRLVVACLMKAAQTGVISEWESDGDDEYHKEGLALFNLIEER